MSRFLSTRLLYSCLALVGLLILVFLLAYLNGSPARLYLPAGVPQATVDQFNAQHGYDQPIWVQFGRFVVNVLHLDFGDSLSQSRPAIDAAMSQMPDTLAIAGIAMALAVVIGITLGSMAALKPFGKADRTISVVTLGATSVPDFWLALLGVLFFAVHLGLVPTSGQSGFSSWILPVATLAVGAIGSIAQVARGAMVESLGSGYVQNARARGYGTGRLAVRHALKNASLPIISIAGDRAANMFNGTVIVCVIFAWPGIGGTLISAVNNRDFPVVQAGIFVVGLSVIVVNIVADIAYALVDPRIRIS